MENFRKFRSAIQQATAAAIRSDPTLDGQLMMQSAGRVVISYAPFEHIEQGARIVIVGITPGAQQAVNALTAARQDILAGHTEADIIARAKVFASFSGPMRTNLVAMMDYVGLNRKLGIATTATLWDEHSSFAHFTSAQRFPVFVNGENYAGNPGMTKLPILRAQLDENLAEDAMALPSAIWIPLGLKATEGVAYLAQKGLIDSKRVLDGLPHPSGANNERISYFLGRNSKPPSPKTNAAALDLARTAVLSKVANLSLT